MSKKPIHVDIFHNENDLSFMLEGKDFRKMTGLSKKEYLRILSTIPDDVKLKRGRFSVIAQENWNKMMHAAFRAMQPLISQNLDEYKKTIQVISARIHIYSVTANCRT